MPTAQERYDIERNREIKNVPLLKILKAQIDKSYNAAADIAQIRLELQAASNLEDWDEYAKLQDKLVNQRLMKQRLSRLKWCSARKTHSMCYLKNTRTSCS